MTIGELAKRSGVHLETIRFYEKKNLLAPARRTASGYRQYDEESMRRLAFIRQAQELGFTLSEIGELLDLRADSPKTCDLVLKRSREKLREVRRKIESLERMEKTLKQLVERCEKRTPTQGCPILAAVEEGCCAPLRQKEG